MKILDANLSVKSEDGKVHKILKVIEDAKKGDVYIRVFSGKYYSKKVGNKVKEDKFSIHMTPDRPDVNLISHTTRRDNEEKKQGVNYTYAIKKCESFAHVFTMLCPPLSYEYYDHENSEGDLTLDSIPFDSSGNQVQVMCLLVVLKMTLI